MITTDKQQKDDALILLLSDAERLCLDAYLFNPSNKIQAFKTAKGITAGDEMTLNNRANSWLSNRTNKAYIDKYRKSIEVATESEISEDYDNQGLSKNDLIVKMESLLRTATDDKLKSDLIMKLNDLKGYKKDTTKADEQQIRFYLPQRCDNCDYKADYQAHNKQNE